VLEKVGLHQVVQDVVFTDPLDGTAAGGAQAGALHPARVAGRAEGVHAGLQAHTVMQQVLADDARERLLHLVWFHGLGPDIPKGAVAVSTLVYNQQLQGQLRLPISFHSLPDGLQILLILGF